MRSTIVLGVVALAVNGVALYFWWRCRVLKAELAAALAKANEYGALLCLEHQTNYRMACQLYGRAAVDRAMRQAHERSGN